MFETINAWLFTLSAWECVSLIFVVFGLFLFWASPFYRIAVVNNKLFGNGKMTLDQHPIGFVCELAWYYGIYYFITSFMAV